MRRTFFTFSMALMVAVGYLSCSGSNDDDVKSTCCERGFYQDPEFNTFECYPVGTTWEVGYSHKQYKDYSCIVRYEVTESNAQGDDIHIKSVKGTVVKLDMTGVDADEATKAVMSGSTEHLDFKIAEWRGRAEAYEDNSSHTNHFREYDYNWPPVDELIHYSVPTDIANSKRQTMRLLDGKDYECLVDAQGHITIKTIGTIDVMFADWNKTADTAPMHRKLLTFIRNGVVIYDSSKLTYTN